jgi:uncharacterized membrane protein
MTCRRWRTLSTLTEGQTMTETTAAEPGRGDLDSNLALLNYGLLFFSIMFAGLTGLIAVVIAYAQRDVANTAVRSHYNFQIRIFWVALILTVIAALCALAAAAVGVGQIINVGFHGEWDAWDTIAWDASDIEIAPSVIVLLGFTAIASLAACFWLMLAPLVGFIRLATQRGMGDRAA